MVWKANEKQFKFTTKFEMSEDHLINLNLKNNTKKKPHTHKRLHSIQIMKNEKKN